MHLRALTDVDAIWTHALANDPLVRWASFDRPLIPLATHVAWLRDRLADPGQLAPSCIGDRFGVVRVDLDAEQAWLSLAVHVDARGHGVGRWAVAQMTKEVRRLFPALPVCALVREENAASLRLFAACGYRILTTGPKTLMAYATR